MKYSTFLQDRGFVHQFTAPTLAEILDGEPRVVYHGIDPSADSAHAGNFVIWMLLRHLADAGHTIIFLVGGGTGMIGDPKPNAERTLLTPEVIAHNVAKIKTQAEKIIGAGKMNIQFVDNAEWLCSENLITFLRDVGKHFTVNELIKKDAIATRLSGDTGISYTEFAYPLLQGYDYLTLYKRYGCTLQVGGSDQWGNIVAGVDLIRRKEQASVHAVTVPLVIDKATGKKFGKSEGNAVWLDGDKTSPFAFYQFWLQVSDESVIDLLKLFTFYSNEEINTIKEAWLEDVSKRHAQERLALAVTSTIHGDSTALAIANVSKVLFSNSDIQTLSDDEMQLLLQNAPQVECIDGEEVVDVLVRSGLASSKREARTFIESGAITMQNTKLNSVSDTVSALNGLCQLLKRGKKQLVVVKILEKKI
ncbi:MAG: tyrosine--tRNA ligase [Candidatus Paceibacteria bacterium]